MSLINKRPTPASRLPSSGCAVSPTLLLFTRCNLVALATTAMFACLIASCDSLNVAGGRHKQSLIGGNSLRYVTNRVSPKSTALRTSNSDSFRDDNQLIAQHIP